MAELVWDEPEDRIYDSGIDRGVLYLSDGTAVPWDGLTEVDRGKGVKTSPAYFDGAVAQNIVELEPFTASVTSFGYPVELTKAAELFEPGGYVQGLSRDRFGFSYRERMSGGGHRIHVIGNAQFRYSGRIDETMSDDPSLVKHTWEITAPRIELNGFPPSAHVIIETEVARPEFITYVTPFLYGDGGQDAGFTSFETFLQGVVDWHVFQVIDNGDGTWTAQTAAPDFIVDLGGGDFQIQNTDAFYYDADSYSIGDY